MVNNLSYIQYHHIPCLINIVHDIHPIHVIHPNCIAIIVHKIHPFGSSYRFYWRILVFFLLILGQCFLFK